MTLGTTSANRTHITYQGHLRRVLGTSADIIEQNKRVVETNVDRFRRTFWLLLVGVLFLSVAGGMYLGRADGRYAWGV